MTRFLYYFFFLCFVVCVSCTDINEIGINGFAASRSLLAKEPAAEPVQNGTLYNYENCTLLYTRGLSLVYLDKDKKNQEFYNFATTTVTPKVSGTCTNASKGAAESILTVGYTGLSGNISDFSMKFTFNASTGSWKLSNLLVSLTCAKDVANCKNFKDLPFNAAFIKSERGFSFHCYQPQLIQPEGSRKNETDLKLSFNKLQVQPFDVVNGRFSYADDCVGFFSSGVWSGLFVSILLTLIFAYGIIMINNISVTDRFDDPKGPGIQVNVQE